MHSWLDQLLRPLLQISSLLHIEADRRPSVTLGSTQVQTPTAPTEARATMAGRRGQTHAGALPPLASSVCKRPDAGSRMSREAPVRFWERAVVRFRRATRLDHTLLTELAAPSFAAVLGSASGGYDLCKRE